MDSEHHPSRIMIRIVTVVLTLVSLSGLGRAETASIELPVLGNYGAYDAVLDLGPSPVTIHSIAIRVSGEAEYGYFHDSCDTTVAECSQPIQIPQSFGIRVRSDEYSWFYGWEQESIGPFHVKGELWSPDGPGWTVGQGTLSIRLVQDHNIIDFWYRCTVDQEFTCCAVCDAGGFVFLEHPIVEVEYSAAVPSESNTWGEIKVQYR